MTLEDVMDAAGADHEATLRRFAGNRALLERIFRKYPADPSFAELRAALSARNYAEVERAAHTMKGVTANLGFQRLSGMCAELVDMVRGGRTEGLEPVFAKVAAEHGAIVAGIAQLG